MWILFALNEPQLQLWTAAYSCTGLQQRCCTAARPKILPTVSTGDRRVAILVLIWKPSRKDSVIYRRSKPRMAAAWHTAAHYQLRVIVPLSSWDHTTCETREPLSPRATAESSSSSSCCSEERISQCRSDGVVICPCRCPADLTMEIWAATWPMYIYLYGRDHGLYGKQKTNTPGILTAVSFRWIGELIA